VDQDCTNFQDSIDFRASTCHQVKVITDIKVKSNSHGKKLSALKRYEAFVFTICYL
jgi:hypothetical protein